MFRCEGIAQYGCINKLRLHVIPMVKPTIFSLSNHIRSYIGLSKGHVAQPYYVKMRNHGCGRNHNAMIYYEVPQIGDIN
jgi:hypothetical protein